MADIVERLRRATLGEFEIGRELGRGGMAAVFLAHEISLDRKVAIKVMSPGLMMGEGMVERFKHEAITIAQLHHPNIVSVYSVRQAEGLHFFVMRYVQGRALEHVVQRAGRLPLPLVRSILHQVGSALTYAHRSRVIHRDVKPGNILIDEDGNAVVTDFGIAKAAERPSRTLTGALVGTPAYMSPEQCSGAEVSGASDQYSLGAVLYELVTGVPPFAGSTLTVMQAHVERSPRPIRELWGDCPPDVEAAILRMLDKDPAARWPRLADAMAALGAAPLAEDDPLRAELAQWVVSDGGATLSGTPTPTSPAPRTRASAAVSGRPVGGISIMPAPADLEAGDSFSLVAVIRGEHGTRLPPRAVRWTTDAPEILRIDGTGGIATAVAPGTAIVTATCKEVSALLRVEVAPPRADDIVIEPMSEPLHMGDEIRLEATPKDKRGWPVYRPVTWTSGDTGVAAVTPHGTIAGLAPGTVRITAALDDARASIVIPVLPPRVVAVDIVDPPTSVVAGRTFVLTATPLDHANNPLPRRAVVWSTSDVSVALATSEGWVAALRPGAVVLTATCEGVRASVRIGVVAEALPLPPTPEPESRHASYRRSRRARRRSILAGLTAGAVGLLWLSIRPATVSERPAGDRGRPGTAGYAAGAIGVDTAAPASLAITTRPTRALRPDSSTRLVAVARDAGGRIVSGALVAWSSGDSTVARVDPSTGQVVAVRPGRVQIVAASGAGRDSVVITVRRRGARVPVVAAITITPPPPLRAGGTATLGALVLGARGDTLEGAEITWSSSDPQVATVEALTGEARGLAPGTTRIQAHSGNQTAVADLTVVPGAAAALQILGARPMAVGEMLYLRVLARDGQGEELPGLAVAWATSDSSVAAVDESTGTVAARAPGSARIAARAEGASAWILVTVLPRPEPLGSAESEGGRQPTEARLQAGVDACYEALRTRDVGRLRGLWRPTSKAEEDKLRRLSRILTTSGWAAVVGDRIDGASTIGLESAAMEFSVPLSWTEANARRVSQPDFRAEFALNAGRWELSGCRMVGSQSF